MKNKLNLVQQLICYELILKSLWKHFLLWVAWKKKFYIDLDERLSKELEGK